MDNAQRKLAHSYRLSFEYEVGSSFDPDMDDVELWERHLRGKVTSISLPLGGGYVFVCD